MLIPDKIWIRFALNVVTTTLPPLIVLKAEARSGVIRKECHFLILQVLLFVNAREQFIIVSLHPLGKLAILILNLLTLQTWFLINISILMLSQDKLILLIYSRLVHCTDFTLNFIPRLKSETLAHSTVLITVLIWSLAKCPWFGRLGFAGRLKTSRRSVTAVLANQLTPLLSILDCF